MQSCRCTAILVAFFVRWTAHNSFSSGSATQPAARHARTHTSLKHNTLLSGRTNHSRRATTRDTCTAPRNNRPATCRCLAGVHKRRPTPHPRHLVAPAVAVLPLAACPTTSTTSPSPPSPSVGRCPDCTRTRRSDHHETQTHGSVDLFSDRCREKTRAKAHLLVHKFERRS